MTEEGFFTCLSQTCDSFQWSVKDSRIEASKDGKCYCPLTAVFALLNGKYLLSCQYMLAAEKLELSREFAQQVALAAGCDAKPYKVVRDQVLQSVKL